MSFDVLDRETLNGLPTLSEVDETYGVRVNALSVDELFALYERTGFLYPAKAKRLLPQMDLVRSNWRRLLQAGDSLLYVLTAGNKQEGWVSIAVWRTTHKGWTWQHHVSDNNPLGSRAVMLGGLAGCMRRDSDECHQNWFRPENRFPARVFGSMVQTIGESLSSVQRHVYFMFPRKGRLEPNPAVRVAPYSESHHKALCGLAAMVRGNVYVSGEELATDVGLEAVNDLYRSVGLRRTRHVWLAYAPGQDEPIGAAIAYRGPLGLNFSFIENRCDLLLHPKLAASKIPGTVAALIKAATSVYTDFELDEIPVVADQVAGPALVGLGGEFLRHYCQGMWLKQAQPRLYRHVDGFYSRLLMRAERYSMQHSLTV
jgi:hypothetical protein